MAQEIGLVLSGAAPTFVERNKHTMRLIISTAVLLSMFATPARSSFPVVVAHGQLLNTQQSVTLATLYDPPKGGQYRLSLEMVVNVDAVSSGEWQSTVNWFDGAGAESTTLSIPAASAYPHATVDLVKTFFNSTQTPITYSLAHTTPDNSSVSVYWTLEQLQ